MVKIVLLSFLLFVPSLVLAQNLGDMTYINYKVKLGDSSNKIVGQDSRKIKLLGIINAVNPKKIFAGSTLKIPKNNTEWSKAFKLYDEMNNEFIEEISSFPQYVIFSLKEQMVRCYEFGRIIKVMPISSGTKDHPTPRGKFSVIKKDWDHTSNLYKFNGKPAEMHWGVQFNGVFWIHHQTMKGKPDSHGCIRLRKLDALVFFYWVDIGTPIIIK